jgi:LacI family transcriptional regulator
MAAATVATAHRRGLEVPRDLSICGFDDTAIATTIWPGLTTIRQPIAEMARIATRLLAEGLRRNQTGRQHEQLAFELVHRGSVAPPPGGQDSGILNKN